MKKLLFYTNLLNEIRPNNKFEKDDESLNSKLYKLLLNTPELCSENEICEAVYGEESYSSKFLTLKSRYKNEIIDELVCTDISGLLNVKSLERRYTVLKIQLLEVFIEKYSASTEEVTEFLEDILKIIIKKEDLYYAVFITSKLAFNHIILKNKDKAYKYEELNKNYSLKLNELLESHSIYRYFAHLVTEGRFYTKQELDLEKIKRLRTLEQRLSQYESYSFCYYVVNSLYYYYLITHQKEALFKICKIAINLFHIKKDVKDDALLSFNVKLGFLHSVDGQYNLANEHFTKALTLNPKSGRSAWLNVKNHQINNWIISQDYERAYETVQEIMRLKHFNSIAFLYREPVLIRLAYLQFLLSLGKFKLESGRRKSFRLYKFLNEVPLYSKDKRGTNIAILIVHILHLFLNKKYDLILNRLESLNSYSFKYLRNDETLRSNAFIKILLQLPRADYHPTRFRRYAEKYYLRLKEAPKHFGLLSLDVEIIPYEQLWDVILDMLEKRKSGAI